MQAELIITSIKGLYMSTRFDKEYLLDIISSIERIEMFVENLNYREFLKDLKSQDAVIKNIEVKGETAGRLSIGLIKQHSDIPWDKIKGTRNRLIHNYSGTNFDILWNIIKDDLPDLYLRIQQIENSL